MKSPTQQAIIFLLEEYINDNAIYNHDSGFTPKVTEAEKLLEALMEDIHNDPELEGRL